MNILITEQPPSPQEYCALRAKCGLGRRTIEAAAIALPRSLFAVSLRTSDQVLIGMGRVVGDQGSHVQVVDIAVDPEFQKQGLSRQIMNRIMTYMREQVPDCAYVNLFADVDYLYQ